MTPANGFAVEMTVRTNGGAREFCCRSGGKCRAEQLGARDARGHGAHRLCIRERHELDANLCRHTARIARDGVIGLAVTASDNARLATAMFIM